MSKQEQLRNRVYCMLENHPEMTTFDIATHFQAEDVPKSTIYSIIKRHAEGVEAARVVGSGRPAVIFDYANINALVDLVDHQKGVSQRQLAERFRCTHQHVSNTLKTQTTIQCFTTQTIPDRTEAQRAAARPKCATLLRLYRNVEWIMDDESYFTLKHSSIHGNNLYYSSDRSTTPANVKYNKTKKFESQLLVWCAISPAGISKICIFPGKTRIDAKIYRDECLKARLLPFIKKHHSNGNYVFWPDLASSHYAEDSLDFMIENGINHVDKPDNPANCPELRPIENFWALIKAKVYEGGWEAENVEQLEQRIRLCMKNFDKSTIQRLVGSINKRLDDVRRHDLIENRQ